MNDHDELTFPATPHQLDHQGNNDKLLVEMKS